MNEQQLLFLQQLLQQNPVEFQNIMNSTGNAAQYQPTSPSYVGSVMNTQNPDWLMQGMGNEWMAQNTPASPATDTYPDLTGAGALENAQSVGMYSDAQTGQLMNVNPNAFRNFNRQNQNAFTGLTNIFQPVSTETATFKLGQSLAFNRNNPYASQGQRNLNTLRGIGAAGKTLTSLLRTGFAGAAFQNRENETIQDYLLRQGQQQFNPLSNQPVFENGGQVTQEQYLTGSYIDENTSQGQPNVEIEANEFVQLPSGNTVQAVGETHERGGIEVNLPEGSRVISDNLKLGGKNARDIRKQYDIEVKANDTFAAAIEKYRKKIGIEKIDKEQEELFSKLKDNTGKEINQTTIINEGYLAKEIQATEASKQPLKQQLTAFTDQIFQRQEQLKGNDVQLQFENGGTYTSNDLNKLFEKHQLTAEQGMEVVNTLKQYADGGGVPPTEYYRPNPFVLPEYANQSFGAVDYIAGNVSDVDIANQRLMQQSTLLPYTLRRSGLLNANNQVVLNPEGIGSFQGGYNEYTAAVIRATENNPNLTQEQKDQIKAQVAQESFTNEGVRAIDQKYGNFTSSRGAFSLPYLTQEDKKKYPNLKFVGDILDEKGEVKPQYVDLSPQAKTLLQQTYKDSGVNAFDIGLLATTDPQAEQSKTQPKQAMNINLPKNTVRSAGLNFVDVSLPPPRGLQASRMPDAEYRNFEAVLQGYEPQLQQLYSQEAAAIEQVQGLTPSQKASAVAQISANTQTAANQVIGQVSQANQQEVSRIQNMNTQLFNQYGIIDSNERERFEQKTFTAQANTDRDYLNWLAYNNTVASTNQQQINQANLYANLFPSVTVDELGRVVNTGNNPVYYDPFPQ